MVRQDKTLLRKQQAEKKWAGKGISRVCVPSGFSHVWLFATLWTVTRRAPLSKGFFRQAYWTGLPFPHPEESFRLRDRTRISCSSCITGGFFTTEPLGKPQRNSPSCPYCADRETEAHWRIENHPKQGRSRAKTGVWAPDIYIYFLICIYLAVPYLKLQRTESSVFLEACRIFCCSMWDLVPWPRIKPDPSALRA